MPTDTADNATTTKTTTPELLTPAKAIDKLVAATSGATDDDFFDRHARRQNQRGDKPKAEEGKKDEGATAKGEETKPETAPTPKPDAKATETKVESVTEDKIPQNKKEWEAFKAAESKRREEVVKQFDELKKQHDALAKEYDAAKKAGPPPEVEQLKQEIEQTKKELEEYRDTLRRVRLEEDPKFKSYFEQQINRRVERAKEVVGKDKATQLESILKLPEGDLRDNQLEEFVSDLTPTKQTRLVKALEEITDLKQERQSEIERFKTEGKAIEERRQAEQVKAQQEEARRARVLAERNLEKIIGSVKELPGLKGSLTDDTANSLKKLALGEINDAPGFVAILAKGLVFDEKTKALEAAQAEIAELKAQMGTLEGAQPRGGAAKVEKTEGNGVKTDPTKHTPGMAAQQFSRWLATQTQED